MTNIIRIGDLLGNVPLKWTNALLIYHNCVSPRTYARVLKINEHNKKTET